MNEEFEKCKHDWKLHVDANNIGPAMGNSLFRCGNCAKCITLTEKCALEQTEAQKKSLKIQEKYTKISMRANIIAAITLIIAFLTLLFGVRLIK